MERFPGEFPPDVVSPDDIPAGANPWERFVTLDHARRWLDLKCDDLRRSCHEMSASLNGRSPLTPADMAVLRARPPHRSMRQISAEFHRLRDESLTPPPRSAGGESDDRLAARVVELAAAVEDKRAERAELRRMFLALFDTVMPDEPITEEELHDMLHGPRGQSIPEILAEIEAELGEKL